MIPYQIIIPLAQLKQKEYALDDDVVAIVRLIQGEIPHRRQTE